MKRLLALLILALSSNGNATNGLSCYPNVLDLVPYGNESKTVSTLSVGLTASKYAPPDYARAVQAIITIEDNPVRYWYDGTDPTSTVGHYAPVGTILTVCQVTIQNIRFIKDTAAAGDAA